MTKEEYLNMYKEEKLAEICSQLDEENDELSEEINELAKCVEELNKKCNQLDVWNDTEQLFKRLETLPAKDFIELYYKMKELIENNAAYKVTCANPNNWGIATINSR